MTARLLIGLIIALVAIGPLALIWALNTLFNAGIAYTFWTWLAALVLSMALTARGSK